MTKSENLVKRTLFTSLLTKRMLLGGAIALAMVGFFVVTAGQGDPSWGPYWRVKPLLLTPFLGAVVGLFFDLSQPLRDIKGWLGKVFLVLSLLGFFIGLWMSMILGLAGTMWN